MKTIAAVTVARSDYGILRPVLRRIALASDLRLQLIVAGTHLSDTHDRTVDVIEADGFSHAAEVSTLPTLDTPAGVAQAIGLGVGGFADAYARLGPDVLLVVGDRFETLAAAVSAVPFTLPIAHMHGGELTAGAIDEQMRHAITKLSHLHFVSTATNAARVVQMGEEPWRVVVSGAPALDEVRALTPWSRARLEDRLGVSLAEAPLLVTYHPVTLEYTSAAFQVGELTSALDQVNHAVVVTAPNVDTANGVVRHHLQQWAAGRPMAVFVENLGADAYWSTMARAAAVVGNSSSGILEAASFKRPVVNVGNRQAGRDRPANVIQVGDSRDEILAGIRTAVSAEFLAGLEHLVNPYGDGHASERIVRVLQDTPLDQRLRIKRFHHLPHAAE